MRKFIHHLRSKKEEERRVILHILVFLFSVIIIFAWIYSLSARLKNTEEINLNKDVKPFLELGNDIGSDINDFKNSN